MPGQRDRRKQQNYKCIGARIPDGRRQQGVCGHRRVKYGTCATAAATLANSGASRLYPGQRGGGVCEVHLRQHQHGGQLNVNSTGAKAWANGGAVRSRMIQGECCALLRYDGPIGSCSTRPGRRRWSSRVRAWPSPRGWQTAPTAPGVRHTVPPYPYGRDCLHRPTWPFGAADTVRATSPL